VSPRNAQARRLRPCRARERSPLGRENGTPPGRRFGRRAGRRRCRLNGPCGNALAAQWVYLPRVGAGKGKVPRTVRRLEGTGLEKMFPGRRGLPQAL